MDRLINRGRAVRILNDSSSSVLFFFRDYCEMREDTSKRRGQGTRKKRQVRRQLKRDPKQRTSRTADPESRWEDVDGSKTDKTIRRLSLFDL